MVRFLAGLIVAYVCLGLGACFGGAAGFVAFHATTNVPPMRCGTGPAMVMLGIIVIGAWCGLIGGAVFFLWLLRSNSTEE